MNGRNEFVKLVFVAALAMTAFGLVGCAGQPYVVTRPDAFVLGKSTRADVYAKVGEHPNSFGSLNSLGKTVKSMTYVQANPFGRGLHQDVTPTRSETFYFIDNVLVGIDYTSSYKEDGTDFDAGKIRFIKKGQSTKSDVIKLLGQPDGYYAQPLIPDSDYRGLVYLYNQFAGVEHISKKKLIVVCDSNGVVTDVKYVASGPHQ